MDKTKFYLDKAAACIQQAENSAPDARSALLTLAEQYARLAEYAARGRDARRGQPPRVIDDEEQDEG